MLITIDNPAISDERKMQNILRAKCLVVGDCSVGKSCIVQTFSSESSNFQKNYSMTCAVDLKTKKVSVPDTNDVVELFIYDSSGKELYSDVLTQLWEFPSMLCIVFDVTNEKSFQNCTKYLDDIQKISANLTIPGVLIGNKIDLTQRRIISTNEATDLAQSSNLRYFECSTKENQGIEEPFFFLVNEWHKLYLEKTDLFKSLS